MGLNTGAKGIGKSAVPDENRTLTLSDIGVDKKLSAHSQKVAAIPEAEFEGGNPALRLADEYDRQY